MKKMIILSCLFWLTATSGVCAADPFAVIQGVWMTEDKDGAIELYRCGEQLCGKFHWLKPASDSSAEADFDDKNPDPALRNRPLCGMQFMGGFTPDANGTFADGWIYSPRHGAIFSSEIRQKDASAIELRGYILLPALGASQTWTRAANIPACTPSQNMAKSADPTNRG